MKSDFFLGLLSGAVIGFLGAYINHLFVASRDKKNRFRSDCLDFRLAFVPVLAKFRHTMDDSPSVATVLAENFEAHLLAYVRFSFAVPTSSEAGLEAAWKQYEKYCEAHGDHHRNQFMGIGGPQYEREQRRLAADHINRLLEFAKDT